jgi:hypothetical protein
MQESKGVDTTEPIYIAHRQKETIDALKKGAITDVRVSQNLPVDKIVSFGLKEGFLKQGLLKFPDPRKNWEVPIEVVLLAQVLQRLNDEHSLLLAPYMLNSAELITELGYNASVLSDGFNDKAIHPRETAFHGETLKHILLSVKEQSLCKWFNQDWLPLWQTNSPGRTKQYVLDGTKIEIPNGQVARFYEDAGTVSDDEGNLSFGYKVVFLYEIIDKKGVIVALKIGPIQRHDIELGRELIKDFPFEDGSSLIMDRGFIDGAWITHLKTERNIDVHIPLRRNMAVTVAAVATADNHPGSWQPHPTRPVQWVYELKEQKDLFWDGCEVLRSGVLVRWVRKDGEIDEVLFATTKADESAKQILSTYDQRAEIEESHRQMKCFQGLEKLPSKKLVQVTFRLIMGVIAYNLMNLFLNSENCGTFESYSLKTLRQKRVEESNPKVIIYTETTFAVVRQFEFLPLILRLKGPVQKHLAELFENLNLFPAPS